MKESPRSDRFRNLWRDVSIGASDGASWGGVLTAALVSAGIAPVHTALGVLAAVVCWALVSGWIAYSTLKSLWRDYQKSIRLQSNAELMQQAIREKHHFLSELDLREEVLSLTDEEIREETSADAAMHWAPPTLREARSTGFRMGFAFLAGGLLSVLPPLCVEQVSVAYWVVICITIPTLLLMHYIKCKLTDVSPWFGSISATLLTVITATGVFMLIQWIRGFNPLLF